MSLRLVQEYHRQLERLIQYGGSRNETSIRSAFQDLLRSYARAEQRELVPELEYVTPKGAKVRPDGTVKDALRQSWGYWESKDETDNLSDEIQKKFARGYPKDNILFEDTQTAVLIQNGEEVVRADMQGDAAALHRLLETFFDYTPPQVREFRKAIEKFKEDLPDVLETLRKLMDAEEKKNGKFVKARDKFLELCRQAINPTVNLSDVREMLIQHILTQEIFLTVFGNSEFHRENNIAKELEGVVHTFFKGPVKMDLNKRLEPYYGAIRTAAGGIADHHEKQKFLKALYENFYRAYNPAGAERLGIFYTPNEIVRFMVESADYLTHKHFGKLLADKGVEILDPATGTGTFVTELIDFIPKAQLKYKFQNEIHCNEVAILPYYVANLNIELTYYQKMGEYLEFPHICFVDTLDNMGFEGRKGMDDLFAVSDENIERIKQQNKAKMMVIIGNPPYRANQANENDNNKNRVYKGVDDRIKDTYLKWSDAQKTKLYDMYVRFLRWASDRIVDNGIVAFVSNNSFLDASSYDGFRKVIADEFNEVYFINMKGDARTSGERRKREGGNVFDDQIREGIAVYFLVKRKAAKGCRIYYTEVGDHLEAEDKKAFLRDNKLENLALEHITPDKDHNWLNIVENDWNSLLPLASKETKLAKRESDVQAIFRLFSLGVITARDEWVYSDTEDSLESKVRFLVKTYNQDVDRLILSSGRTKFNASEIANQVDYTIKWTRAVKNDLLQGTKYKFSRHNFRECLYRPFVKLKLYFAHELNEMQYQMPQLFPKATSNNTLIAINVGSTVVRP